MIEIEHNRKEDHTKFFFLIDKKQIYIDNEGTQEYTGREQKGTKAQTAKKTKTTKKTTYSPTR